MSGSSELALQRRDVPPGGDDSVRVRIGHVWLDVLSFDKALDAIGNLVDREEGGVVFTPNVDHVVLAETDLGFRRAYELANLVLVDGTPVFWASRLLGTPLPQKVSGSDLLRPLASLAAARRWRVFLLGGAPGVAERVADRLQRTFGVDVVGVAAPAVDPLGRAQDEAALLERIRCAAPHLLFVAFGTPKQELWIGRVAGGVRPTVCVGVGAAFDFIAGTARRSPAWMSHAGLEWLFRLAANPRRLWRRYLVRDPRFLLIVLQTLRVRRSRRIRRGSRPGPPA
jgi:N-acetylglucosaminyldiphosphoundecaprenol N-acetyl-beta-D-mannosaminyltransferase